MTGQVLSAEQSARLQVRSMTVVPDATILGRLILRGAAVAKARAEAAPQSPDRQPAFPSLYYSSPMAADMSPPSVKSDSPDPNSAMRRAASQGSAMNKASPLRGAASALPASHAVLSPRASEPRAPPSLFAAQAGQHVVTRQTLHPGPVQHR